MKAEELKNALADLGGSITVDEERGRFIAVVVSPKFEGINQGERQHLVWQRVIDTLSSEDSVAIEFIFTYSPSEQARLDRGEAEEAQD